MREIPQNLLAKVSGGELLQEFLDHRYQSAVPVLTDPWSNDLIQVSHEGGNSFTVLAYGPGYFDRDGDGVKDSNEQEVTGTWTIQNIEKYASGQTPGENEHDYTFANTSAVANYLATFVPYVS